MSGAIEDRVFPGCVVGVVWGDGERLVLPCGRQTYGDDSPVMNDDTMFDVASITKSIPTATLALMAVERDLTSFDGRITDWVPEFRVKNSRKVTLMHLLTHTLDFGYSLSSLKRHTPERVLDAIFQRDMRSFPGSVFSYCNATSILLGIFVERVLGGRLDELAEKNIFTPLQMKRTTFHPENIDLSNMAPTEYDEWRGSVVHGVVHDESAYRLREIMVPGSAGLFSCVPDLLNFIEMLLNNGTWGETPVLKIETVSQIAQNRLAGIGESAGPGWELNRREYMGDNASDSTIGKTGFTGCVVMCDFKKRTGLAFLSNHIHPKRRENADIINRARRGIADIVFGK